MRPEALLRYLAVPLRASPLMLIAAFSVLEWLGGAAGWLGVPLRVLVASWTWSYAYVLVDSTAHGLPVPTLSVEMVNPLHEPRPLGLLLLLFLAASLAWWCDARDRPDVAVGIVALTLALFPASLAVLAVEGSLWRAAWPPALLRVAAGLGLSYILLIGAAFGAAGLLMVSAGRLPSLLWYALSLTLLFSLAGLLGGALYERRDALGLEAIVSPERSAERESRLTARERDREVDQIYALVRARQIPAALSRLEVVLGPSPVDPATYRWLRDRAAEWEDARVADRLTAELISRLLVLGRRGEALLVLEDWWRRGRSFVAHATRDLDLLESAAAEVGHAATRERLLAERAARATSDPPRPDPRA